MRPLRYILLCAVWFFLFTGLMTLAYRVVPPVSTLMLYGWLTGERVERTWVPLERMPSHLVRAVLVSEDARLCLHHGIDWRAARRAYAVNEKRGRITHGASTLPMQLAKNLFLWNGRAYIRKAFELPIALWIDLIWPKRRIAEVYLNIVEWGPGIYGAGAAARYHFGVPVSQLSPAQSSLLAASLPNPKRRRAGAPSAALQGLAANLRTRMAQELEVAGCIGTDHVP